MIDVSLAAAAGPDEHGGNLRATAERLGVAPEALLDFSSNINPLGPPEWLSGFLGCARDIVARYPDPRCTALRETAAVRFGLSPERVAAGNGSSELLFALARAFPGKRAVIPVPAYIDYQRAAQAAGLATTHPVLSAEEGFALKSEALADALRSPALVLLGHPNNPTGRLLDADDLLQLASVHADSWFVMDESYLDFAPGARTFAVNAPENVAVLRSLTKIYAIPGLRLGLFLGAERLVSAVNAQLPPWNVNGPAQAVGERALGDIEFAHRSAKEAARLREELFAELDAFPGLRVFPSSANFLLCRVESGDAGPVFREAERRGLVLRDATRTPGLGAGYFRVAVRRGPENERLIAALGGAFGRTAGTKRVSRDLPPAIMVQGLTSNAGKSVLAAALCRIFTRRGLRTVPFKAQNMSLNSFVTREGGEMGRAQATQALACGLEPDVRMNPVLLKPSSETGSQVIVLGKPVGNMSVEGYFARKPEFFLTAQNAYRSLATEADLVILEGAGSPAEINLRRHDMVNMAMARFSNASVLLVGDIDRGGVFASFVGTLALLTEEERGLVRGLVVNRFRGRRELLEEGLRMTEGITGAPFVGVVPYVGRLDLPDEDSVSLKCGEHTYRAAGRSEVDVACIDLPRLSNASDLDALAAGDGVGVRMVRWAEELGRPDVLILPGSKNVREDFDFLERSGLACAIRGLAEEGRCEIVGLCGGLQMLGSVIRDPSGVEGSPGEIQGLGLLPLDTKMEQGKTLTQCRARHTESGCVVRGYEIHHGRTTPHGALENRVVREDGEAIGFGRGVVWGTYLHGLFDEEAFRLWFVNRVRSRKGQPLLSGFSVPYDVHAALDRLADVVENALDMQAVELLVHGR